MKRYLIFDNERFSEGGYSKAFTDVYDALVRSNVIMSPEASEEVLKAIWENGKQAGMDYTPLDKNYEQIDYDAMRKEWEQLKKEL